MATTREHTYKGERIVRSDYVSSKRWQIISYHRPTGLRYAEEPGSGYATLAAAKAAIDIGQEMDALNA